jgi:hypothetical protein
MEYKQICFPIFPLVSGYVKETKYRNIANASDPWPQTFLLFSPVFDIGTNLQFGCIIPMHLKSTLPFSMPSIWWTTRNIPAFDAHNGELWGGSV